MKNSIWLNLFALCIIALTTNTVRAAEPAAPFLHALFSDNAVLQRDREVPIWGWATPGQNVTVKLDTQTRTARTDQNGRWMARVGPFPAGGPHTLTVSRDGETVTRNNVMFGDVWLCSGQSNMEMGVANVNNAQQEIASANYPNIRLFTVPKGVATTPQTQVNSQWLICTPENIQKGAWGGFSAAAYFFGRKLNQELKIPIGLIHSSWGGTIGEAWVSESALGTLPDFRGDIARVALAAKNDGVPYETQMNQWLSSQSASVDGNWAAPATDDAKWQNIAVPGNWENAGVSAWKDFDGIALYRRAVEIPNDWAGKDLTLHLGAIDDADTTYWNGAQIGSGSGWEQQRVYKIPGAQVLAGRNLLAVRVLDNSGNGGMTGPAEQLNLQLDDANKLPLAGQWKFDAAVPLAKMSAAPLQLNDNTPNIPTVLYNAMIAPLVPYGVKGALWYQGESNAGRAEQYGRLLPVLIGDWREKFASPLPFHIVQLAGFMAPDQTPQNDDWPRLRAAQMQTALNVPRTGIAITTDIGDEKDIHPKDKQDVGLRLALSALAQDYGLKIESSGPVPNVVTPKGERLILDFTHADGGLMLKGEADRVFAVAGADRNWFWATPQIEGKRVILTSAMVPKPMYVRFGWSNLPRASLYNGAGLPAAPFETVGK